MSKRFWPSVRASCCVTVAVPVIAAPRISIRDSPNAELAVSP
jgi:hypothetical protein